MRKLFGTDGIRGTANEHPLTIDISKRLAEVIALKFCSCEVKKHSVIIGKDTRISCDMFEHAMAATFCACGIDVELLGVVPTPAVSILTPAIGASAGIMISASHNPFYDNGIKLFNEFGLKLKDKDETEIEEIMSSSLRPNTSASNIGRIKYDPSKLDFYCNKIKNSFNFNDTIKVVVDSSNGSFSKIASNLLKEFGFEVISIYDAPNGININENCGAINPHILSEAVLCNKADIGIAFDGDGDRVLLSDENGEIIDGNHIIAILAKSLAEGSQVVSTIMANFGLEKYLLSIGLELIRTNVGDRYISECMQNSGAEFGGEPSGHIIIKSHALTGDGLFASLKIIEYLLKSKKKSSQLRLFEMYKTVSNNLRTSDKSVILKKAVASVIKKFESQLEGRGKLIVRPSGTEPIIRISAEGENKLELQNIVDEISKVINAN